MVKNGDDLHGLQTTNQPAAAPSGAGGGSIQNAITSLSDLIDSSFRVRSPSVAVVNAELFLFKNELQ